MNPISHNSVRPFDTPVSALPPKPDKLEAIKIVQDVYKGLKTGYCLVEFETYREKSKTRSEAYRGFSFLCHANTTQEAGWLVCRYAEKGTCAMTSAIRPFNPRTGGTATLKQHTEDHERSGKRNVLGFPFKLQKTDKTRVIQAGAKAVILSSLPFSFAESAGMMEFARALFEAGQGCAPGTNVDIKDLMPSRSALRDAVQSCADKERAKFVTHELKDLLERGGAVTCDGLKQKINGVKFYDLIVHYLSTGLKHPKEGYTNIRLVSRVLLLRENKSGESGNEIKEVLESGMKHRYGISFKKLMDSGFTFVTDCASNMPRIVGMSSSNAKISFNENWMGCICHQLNTAMKHAINEDTRLNGIVSKNVATVKKIVNFFKSSNLNKFLPEGYKLIQDVETRFGTTHDVISRFMKASSHVDALVAEGSASSVGESVSELLREEKGEGFCFPALQAIVSCLGPLREIQTRLEASASPTMHVVLPMLEHAKRILSGLVDGRAYGPMLELPHPAETNFAKLVLKQLDSIEVHPLWIVGCLLHPRLRALSMVRDSSKRSEYSTKGAKLLRNMCGGVSGIMGVENVVGDDTIRAERRNRMLNTGLMMGDFNLEEHLDMVYDDALGPKDEVSRYEEHLYSREESAVALQKDFGIVRFWLSQKDIYPTLFRVAMRVYATPASSTPSERNFSHVNRIITHDRSRLTSDIVEDLVCTHSLLQQ